MPSFPGLSIKLYLKLCSGCCFYHLSRHTFEALVCCLSEQSIGCGHTFHSDPWSLLLTSCHGIWYRCQGLITCPIILDVALWPWRLLPIGFPSITCCSTWSQEVIGYSWKSYSYSNYLSHASGHVIRYLLWKWEMTFHL